MQGSTTFKELKVANWRQFLSVDIEFHPHLTVLTGVNGAGKSTLLNILTNHLGIARPYLGVPNRTTIGERFFSGALRVGGIILEWLKGNRNSNPNADDIGQIRYSNDIISRLWVPTQVGLQYQVNTDNMQRMIGFHMPSHREMPAYRPVPHVSFNGTDPRDAFQQLIGFNYIAYAGQRLDGSLLFSLKQILINWAAIGEGNSTFKADKRQYEAYSGFIEILRKILPAELGFTGLSISAPEILIETQSGTFLIDSASGGLLTLIEIAALIYTCSLRQDVQGGAFVVTFDEPENHLHPSLQRSLLPALVDAFPQVQFIVATHSPFMVSSLRDSFVYALRHRAYDVTEPSALPYKPATRWVESARLDHANRAGSASEILRDVLGVPVTLPAWVQRDLEAIVANYSDRGLDETLLADLRREVDHAGLGDLFSDAVSMLAKGR